MRESGCADDPASWAAASVGPELPHDSAEDVFEDAILMESKSAPIQFPGSVDDFARRVFRRFWSEWSQIQNEPTHSSGEEGAIALLQTMTKSKTRETSLNAYCYLLAIGRTPLSQTEVAVLFWGETDGKKHRATINARVSAIKEDLGLSKARGMKSDRAREVFSERATRIHTERIEHPCSKKPSLFKSLITKPRTIAPQPCAA